MNVYIAAEPFVSGGLAACFASFVIHPIDLAKVRLQLMDSSVKPKPSFLKIILTIQQTDGIKAVYAGLSAALSRQGTIQRSIFTCNTQPVFITFNT